MILAKRGWLCASAEFKERWVLNLSEEDRERRDEETRKRLLSQIGFRRLWAVLTESQRPVVVHNGFFDLLFLMAAFEGPLPKSLVEYKALVHRRLPHLFDTKVLAEAPELSGKLSQRSSLPELSLGLSECLSKDSAGVAPFAAFTLADGFGAYAGNPETGGSFHTAGYDAYATGKVFGYFKSVLGDQKAQDFENRVFLMWSAFELRLAEATDRLSCDGVARYVHGIDTKVINSRTLLEILKPILDEGKLKVNFRWSGDGKSMLLILQHPHSEALSTSLDELLKKQQEQGRLQFCPLQEHLNSKSTEAADASAGCPAAKRQRAS